MTIPRLTIKVNKEEYSSYFAERVGISRNWVSTHYLTFMVSLGIVKAPLGVSLSCHVTKGLKKYIYFRS